MENKATTPAEVMDRVKIGMTGLQVAAVIDQENFIRHHAFVALNFSLLEVIGDLIIYETTQILTSPYYGWLLFDPAGRDSDPAIIGFESASETVLFAARIPFAEAQGAVLWRFDRTKKQKVGGKVLKAINKGCFHLKHLLRKGEKGNGGR